MGNKGSRTDLLRVTKDQRTNKGNKGTDALRVGATDASCSNEQRFPIEAERAIQPTPEAIRRRELPFHSPEMAIQNDSLQTTSPNYRMEIGHPRIKVDARRDENLNVTIFGNEYIVTGFTKGIVKISSKGKRSLGFGMAFVAKEGKDTYLYTSKHNFVYGKEEEEGTTVQAKNIKGKRNKWKLKKLKGEPNKSPKELRSFDNTYLLFPGGQCMSDISIFSRGNPPTPGDCNEMKIPRLDQPFLHRDVFWRYGFDAVRFKIKKNVAETMKAFMDFYEFPEEEKIEFKEGMEIGIVVWDIKYGENDSERPACLGAREDINIYRGKILRCNTYSIDCSYNSYSGCSGAPVICIDQTYQNYFGKVIAIHAGTPSEYKQNGIPGDNIAFKLSKRSREENVFTANNRTKLWSI